MHSTEHFYLRLNTKPNLFGFILSEWETDRRLIIITNPMDLLSFFKSEFESKKKDFLCLAFKTLITSNANIDYPLMAFWSFLAEKIHFLQYIYYYGTFEEIWNDFWMTHKLMFDCILPTNR